MENSTRTKENIEKESANTDSAENMNSAEPNSEDSSAEEQKPTIEERFASLDQIITRMDEEDVPLEEAFSLYQSGLAQVKAANAMLDSMEAALLQMNESGELEDFE